MFLHKVKGGVMAAKTYESTLFVIGGSLAMPPDDLAPYLRKINQAVSPLGIATEVVRIPGMVATKSACAYADPIDSRHRVLDTWCDRVGVSKGIVVVNPDSDVHQQGEMPFAVSGIAAHLTLAAREHRSFLTHVQPWVSGYEPSDEGWLVRLRELRGATALNGQWDRLTNALR